MRAVVFLNCLTTIDRFSDFSIQIGNANPDISKLRIPGKINVNTASGDVLRAIPNMTDQMVANILGYRSGTPATYGTTSATTNLTGSITASEGHGFHTLGELLVALATPAQATMDLRDKAWASVFNLCTVRSDTFAVYGYMEAVRQNPNFAGFSDKPDSLGNKGWYTPSTDAAYSSPAFSIDDPHNTGPLIRVARRRWIAIVDRSFSNYAAGSGQFVLPRVVAIKDLPQ